MGRFNLSLWGLRHGQFIGFMIVIVALAGAIAYFRLGRAEDPDFTVKNVAISVIWPGATAQEMQDQVADKIEKKLQELPYADRVETYAKSGFASIGFVFKDSTPPREVPALYVELRKKMADVRADLPPGVIGPSINDEFGDVDNVLYTIRAPGLEPSALKAIAEALRKRMQRVPDVKRVDVIGDRPERVYVEFSQAKLATLGVPLQALLDSLAKQTPSNPPANFRPRPRASPCGYRARRKESRKSRRLRSPWAGARFVSATSPR